MQSCETNPDELIPKLGPLNRAPTNLEVHLVSETFHSAASSSQNIWHSVHPPFLKLNINSKNSGTWTAVLYRQSHHWFWKQWLSTPAPPVNLLFIKLILTFLCSTAFAHTFCFSWNRFILFPCLAKVISPMNLSHYLLWTFWIAFVFLPVKGFFYSVRPTKRTSVTTLCGNFVIIYIDFIRVSKWSYRFKKKKKKALRCTGLELHTYTKYKTYLYIVLHFLSL